MTDAHEGTMMEIRGYADAEMLLRGIPLPVGRALVEGWRDDLVAALFENTLDGGDNAVGLMVRYLTGVLEWLTVEEHRS